MDFQKIEIFDPAGRLVDTKRGSNTLNISHLDNGSYILNIYFEGQNVFKSIQKF